MLRVIVPLAVALLAIVGILTGAAEAGGRMTWPIAVALVGAMALIDWLRLRKSTRGEQDVADRLMVYTVLLLIAVWTRL
jgi:hypothetical protein